MDNKKKIVLLSLILLGFLSSVKVFGLYKLNTDTVRWDGGEGKSYDPFFLKQYVQSVQARIFFDKAVAGDTFITISKGGGDNYDRNFSVGTLSGRDFDTFSTQQLGYDRKARCGDFSLNYQLYGTTDVLIPLKALPEAQNYQDVISYSFSGQENSSISLQYYLVVPPGQVVPPGMYVDVYMVTLYQGNINNPFSATILDQVQVKLSIEVDEALRYVIKGVKTKDNVLMPFDFGVLETGKTKELDVAVYSNVPYSLQFSSKYQGKFIHKSSDVKTTLPYWVTLDSKPVLFKKDAYMTVDANSNLTDKLGRLYHFVFKLDNTSSLLSGEYLDQISWNLKPL